MPITVNCPTCNRALRVPDELLGKRVKCPACATVLTASAEGAIQPAAPPPSQEEGGVRRKRPTPPPEEEPQVRRKKPAPEPEEEDPMHPSDERTHACPFCGETILVSAKKCKHCGEMIDPSLRAAQEAKRSVEHFQSDLRGYDAENRTDAPGVISLIFGCIAVVCVLLGCFTCGITWFAAIPFAGIGAGVGFLGKGNLRVAGLVLNLLALVPAIILTVLFLTGVLAGAMSPRR